MNIRTSPTGVLTTPRPSRRVALVTVASALLAGTAWAEKPEWAGHGRPDKPEKHKDKGRDPRREWAGDDRRAHRPSRGEHGHQGDQGRDRWRSGQARPAPRADVGHGRYFNERHRTVVRDYYEPQWRAGKCPPGLAKKNNGCMPPGQAKKWRVGQRLPAGVAYYPVPQPVVVQLGMPPAGYQYVRVASDILLIATGTRMVMDGISGFMGY